GDFAGTRHVEIAHDRIGRRAYCRQQTIECASFLLQLTEPASALENLNLPLEHIDCVVELLLHCGSAVEAHKAVRIFSGRKRYNAHGKSLPQQLVSTAECRFESRRIAIVKKEDVARVLSKQTRLHLRERSAKWCDYRLDSRTP